MKKIVGLVAMLSLISHLSCFCIDLSQDENFSKYCGSKLGNYREWKKSKGDWTTEWENVEGKDLPFKVSPDREKTILAYCLTNPRLKQLEEDTRFSHQGLNLELDRRKAGLKCTNTNAACYEIYAGGEANLMALGEKIRESKKKAEQDLENYINEFYKKNDAPCVVLKKFLVPNNKLAVTLAAAGLSYNAFKTKSNVNKLKKGESKTGKIIESILEIPVILMFSKAFSNLIPWLKGETQIFPEVRFQQEYKDLKHNLRFKELLLHDYYALVSEKSTGYGIMANRLSSKELKTHAGIPMTESIKKHGVLLELPKSLDEIWENGHGCVYNIRSQADQYEKIVETFGEQYVQNNGEGKSKIEDLKQLPKT